VDLKPLTMDAESAQAMYDEYRALGDRTNEDDQAIVTMLREVQKGRQLIDLDVAIPGGGHDELGRPKLAASRGDQLEVKMVRGRRWRYVDGKHTARQDGDLSFLPANREAYEHIAANARFDFPADRFEDWPEVPREWFAMVPPVPPRLRPRGALSRYAIVWEVDEWSARSKTAPPPVDPALLRHIMGSLYAVIAVWDLTAIERLVLGMTRRG